MNNGCWEIDIHSCYSLVKIAFVPICASKKNLRIWRHNAIISRSRDVIDQLWWRHNANLEFVHFKSFPGNNGEMNGRWLFLAELGVQDMK